MRWIYVLAVANNTGAEPIEFTVRELDGVEIDTREKAYDAGQRMMRGEFLLPVTAPLQANDFVLGIAEQ
jgi:hypothetical protein